MALRSMTWSEVLEATRGLDWRVLILAFGVVLSAWFLEAVRWKLLLPREKISTTRLFLVKSTGSGLNNISPVRLIAEVAQTVMLHYGSGIRADKVISSLLMAKMLDLLITANVMGIGLIMLPQLSGLRPVVLPFWGVTMAGVFALLFLGKHIRRLPIVRRFQSLESIVRSLGQLTAERKAVAMCVALTAASWMLVGLAAWLVGVAVGIDLPPGIMFIVMVAVTLFSGFVPSPPGAVGVYEFGFISTLGLFSVDPAVALTFALVMHALVFLPPIAIGAAVLMGERQTTSRIWKEATTSTRIRARKAEASP